MLIIDDLLLWLPAKGFVGILKTLQEEAEQEMLDVNLIKKELTKLQLQFDLGIISQKDFDKNERKLLNQLEQVRKSKQTRKTNITQNN